MAEANVMKEPRDTRDDLGPRLEGHGWVQEEAGDHEERGPRMSLLMVRSDGGWELLSQAGALLLRMGLGKRAS